MSTILGMWAGGSPGSSHTATERDLTRAVRYLQDTGPGRALVLLVHEGRVASMSRGSIPQLSHDGWGG